MTTPSSEQQSPLAIQFIGSGSKGNAALLRAGGAVYLLDAGLSGRKILQHLKTQQISPESLAGVFISHGHGDHIKGLAALLPKISCPVFGTRGTLQELHGGGIFPVQSCQLQAGRELERNGLRVWPFRVPHDSWEPIGLRLEYQGQILAIATDLGHLSPEAFSHLIDSDILCLESNYDEDMLAGCKYPGWLKTRIRGPIGHLSNNGVRGILARQTRKMSHLLLVHLSQESNTPELVRKNLQTMLLSAYRSSIPTTIAQQDAPTSWISAGTP